MSPADRELRESDVSPNPLIQFGRWYEDAVTAQVPQPEAMTVATATPQGRPSARLVLLRGFDQRGFVFFSNYESRKGAELAANPQAALVFFWKPLERQVRVEGQVEALLAAESDAYFRSRPRGSQLGAWASPQSQVIANRDVLERRVQELSAAYEEQDVSRPTNWGGYRVLPDVIEFWQGRDNRLHDRLRYRRLEQDRWVMERLAP